MKTGFTIIRVSEEDQLRGYGPDVQWFEDVLPTAPKLGVEVSEALRAVIQEPATGWDRQIFQKAVYEALRLHREGQVAALMFPRVDRETRFLFGSFPLLAEVIRSGVEVYFARERLRLDPDDPESVERYFTKATQAQAYVETMKLNTARGKKRRAIQDHKMPGGGKKWAFEYEPATGRYQRNEARADSVAKCYQWILEEGISLNKCCQRLEQAEVPPPGWELWQKAKAKGREWRKRRPPVKGRWYGHTLREVLLDEANMGKFYAYRYQRVKGADGKLRLQALDQSRWLLVYEDPASAIVTHEQYEALKKRLHLNWENSQRHTKHPYPPLRGMVLCTLCRRRMVGWTDDRSQIAYYSCPECRNVVQAHRLWDELRREVSTRLLEPQRLLSGMRSQLDSGQALARLQAEEKRLEQQLETWEHARDKARRLYFITEGYPEERFLAEDRQMLERQRRMAGELEEVRGQIGRLKEAIADEEGTRRFCMEAAQNLANFTEGQWRMLLERMKVKVEVSPGEAAVVHMALPASQGESATIAYQSWALSG